MARSKNVLSSDVSLEVQAVLERRDGMAKSRLFGDRPGTVAVVDAPVSASFARRARVAFLSVSASSGVLTASVLAVFTHLLAALILGVVAGVVCGFTAAVLVWAWPVLRVLWWWSAEIAMVALLVLGPALVARVSHPLLGLAVLLVPVAVCVAVGRLRRRLVAWSWCLIVRHRLRLCFAEFVRAASRTRAGCLPLMLWARPTPAGERVWLWLRPGLDLTDLEGKSGKLAVACWAGEARIVRASTRYAALLRVDVVRRDPLTGLVVSPLASLVPRPRGMQPSGSVSSSVAGLELADVPEPAVKSRGGRR
jgi:hypothetical protein